MAAIKIDKKIAKYRVQKPADPAPAPAASAEVVKLEQAATVA